MSKKFVSKNQNYMIVLKPGVEGNRALGTQAISGLYIKFQDGMVDVKEDSIAEQLREHPSFGTDFVEIEENKVDPFADSRVPTEPIHVTTEIDHGYAGKTTAKTATNKLTPQMKRVIKSEAIKMIPDLLKSNPQILKDIMVQMSQEVLKSKDVEVTVKETRDLPEGAPEASKMDPKRPEVLKDTDTPKTKETSSKSILGGILGGKDKK